MVRYKRFLTTPKPFAIRLLRKGCSNRPFYHIVVARPEERCISSGVEQIGVYDPMPNERGEKLISLNLERFKYYVAEGAWVRSTVAMLLGTVGVTPIHPHAYTLAWRNRRHQLELEKDEKQDSDKTN
ncbi:small ribosomal subunit protein bS16m [Parasteatoda tepidariorum]|uniref:small ribosomal subunit protein bS16m n=1 Tax=Parasteatoda tepidariorum TaxID=114398 RepID=UPI00077FADE6|nr:probable 28S ribosomal protein S16, mitochondrial [Parasteatoda tepidariorum]XP_015906596.1 probable 28S ribosomal protein S16, mitochondrial [Parasteatoda tepidariorum]